MLLQHESIPTKQNKYNTIMDPQLDTIILL